MPRLSRADRDLVERLLARDELAFTELVHRHHASMARLARAFVSSPAVAEEVVQETWVAVLDGLESFEGRSSLKTWMFTILTNRAKSRGVREGRSIPFSAVGGPPGTDEPAVDPDRFAQNGHWVTPPSRWARDTPADVVMRDESRELLENAIADLPPNQQVVVTLRDVQGWSSDEVCNLLGISETNQRVLLHRGRAKMRRALEEYLGRE
jgi:RNA polymerase sigma-70 factor (ECF subfamily)